MRETHASFSTSEISDHLLLLFRKMSVRVGNTDVTYGLDIQGHGKNVYLNMGNEALKPPTSSGDIITALAVWLKSMQENWLSYKVILAVILVSVAFLYCVVCFRFNRKKNNQSQYILLELAKSIHGRRGTSQLPLPLPTPGLLPLVSVTDRV